MQAQAKPKMQWTGHLNGRWMPVGETTPHIMPGVYRMDSGNMFEPWHLVPEHQSVDRLILTGLCKDIYQTIEKFCASADKYARFGFTHKKGILLLGAPGTGKTMTIKALSGLIIKCGGIALTSNGDEKVNFLAHALGAVRAAEPEITILHIMEDIEYLYAKDEKALCYLLDGSNNELTNIVHVATSNVPDALDARFLNRPGRFDEVHTMTGPDKETRKAFLAAMLPEGTPDKEIDALVDMSEGLLLSHMRAFVEGVYISGRTPQDTAKTLTAMNAKGSECKAAKGGLDQIRKILFE